MSDSLRREGHQPTGAAGGEGLGGAPRLVRQALHVSLYLVHHIRLAGPVRVRCCLRQQQLRAGSMVRTLKALDGWRVNRGDEAHRRTRLHYVINTSLAGSGAECLLVARGAQHLKNHAARGVRHPMKGAHASPP